MKRLAISNQQDRKILFGFLNESPAFIFIMPMNMWFRPFWSLFSSCLSLFLTSYFLFYFCVDGVGINPQQSAGMSCSFYILSCVVSVFFFMLSLQVFVIFSSVLIDHYIIKLHAGLVSHLHFPVAIFSVIICKRSKPLPVTAGIMSKALIISINLVHLHQITQ